MRFRRETGDFSIKLTFNEETGKLNDIQLPKGLSAEELLGVFVSVTTEVRPGVTRTIAQPITIVFDMGYYSAVMLNSPSNEPPEPYFYDPKTGILGEDQPAPPESDGIVLTAEEVDAASQPMYMAAAACSESQLVNGASVTLIDQIPGWDEATHDCVIYQATMIPGDTDVTYGPNLTKTVPAGSYSITLQGADGEAITAPYLYWNRTTGYLGHVSYVFSSSGSGSGSISL